MNGDIECARDARGYLTTKGGATCRMTFSSENVRQLTCNSRRRRGRLVPAHTPQAAVCKRIRSQADVGVARPAAISLATVAELANVDKSAPATAGQDVSQRVRFPPNTQTAGSRPAPLARCWDRCNNQGER